jgi:tetrahydromethanopterin S-methyltransferase subunit F
MDERNDYNSIPMQHRKNMTSKETAEELYCKMIDAMPQPNITNIATYVIAKRCALIAIDEVLKYSKAHGFIGLTDEYKQVKKQIKNL